VVLRERERVLHTSVISPVHGPCDGVLGNVKDAKAISRVVDMRRPRSRRVPIRICSFDVPCVSNDYVHKSFRVIVVTLNTLTLVNRIRTLVSMHMPANEHVNLLFMEENLHSVLQCGDEVLHVAIIIIAIQRTMTGHDNPWNVVPVGVGLLQVGCQPRHLITECVIEFSSSVICLRAHTNPVHTVVVETVPHVGVFFGRWASRSESCTH